MLHDGAARASLGNAGAPIGGQSWRGGIRSSAKRFGRWGRHSSRLDSVVTPPLWVFTEQHAVLAEPSAASYTASIRCHAARPLFLRKLVHVEHGRVARFCVERVGLWFSIRASWPAEKIEPPALVERRRRPWPSEHSRALSRLSRPWQVGPQHGGRR